MRLRARREGKMDDVERWGIFEISLEGPQDGNPFLDVEFGAQFRHRNRIIGVDGFYDGGSSYRVRFMPDTAGSWTYVTKSNRDELDGESGRFMCVKPSPENHGPVRVRNTYHRSIAFLRQILEEGPDEGLDPKNLGWDVTCAGKEGEYYLAYFGIHQPAFRALRLPEENRFSIEVIDTWEMTITPVEGIFKGECQVRLPGKPYMALRISTRT
jgi:hypothetical protein